MSYQSTSLTAGLVFVVGALCAQPVPFVNTPTIPETVAPGRRGLILTVNGCGFASNSVVDWNGSPRATTFVSETQLTAKIPPADIATAQTASITVVTPGRLKRISSPVLFEVVTSESFPPIQNVATTLAGGRPTVADVNGDGIPDIISIDSTVLVALGMGGGQYGAQQSYTVADDPQFVAVGDVNGDGKPDLVVAALDGLEYLLNNGDGTFGSPHVLSDDYFNCIVLGDFNGDGRLDIAAGTPGLTGQVLVFLHKSGSGFMAPVAYDVVQPFAITEGDFNGDNALDLAVLNEDDSISILLGNGDGTFQPQTIYQTGSQEDGPTAIIAADFNGDGKLDLARAAGDFLAGTGILLGNGDGTFQPVQDNLASSYGLVPGDFNGDGKLDLATGANGSLAGFFFGNGNGTFQSFQNVSNPMLLVGFYPAAADFNNNGRLDLVIGTDGNLELLMQ